MRILGSDGGADGVEWEAEDAESVWRSDELVLFVSFGMARRRSKDAVGRIAVKFFEMIKRFDV